MQWYNVNEPSKFIVYLDEYNVYSWEIFFNTCLVVDLNGALEKLEISDNMLPNYRSNVENEYGIKIGGVNKLFPNLVNQSKYVLHYRNLQLYFLLGMKWVRSMKL